LILFLALLLTSSCVARKEIEAATWLNNFNAISDEHCLPGGALYQIGFFRRLNDGKFQFISACSATGERMLSMTAEDYKKLLDAAFKRDK